MFAYCGNNPVFREDDSGTIWGAILIGATVNLVTSYLAAKITNQQFTLVDGLVAVAAGGVGAVLPGVGGFISGAYTAHMAYKNGAEMTFFAPPVIINDRIMLPTDALAALGFHFYTEDNKLYIY